MKYVKTFDEHLNEGIIDKLKSLFKKGEIESIPDRHTKDDDPTEFPNDEDWDIAAKFAKSEKGSIGGIGVDKKTGYINIEVDYNGGSVKRFQLDRNGKPV